MSKCIETVHLLWFSVPLTMLLLFILHTYKFKSIWGNQKGSHTHLSSVGFIEWVGLWIKLCPLGRDGEASSTLIDKRSSELSSAENLLLSSVPKPGK